MPVIGYTPTRKMTAAEAASAGLELTTADDIYIPYNDAAPEFGAYELDGVPYTDYVVPEKIVLTCTTANSSQEVVAGQPIEDIVFEWNEAGYKIAGIVGPPAGLSASFDDYKVTISGTPTESCSFDVKIVAPEGSSSKPVTATVTIKVVTPYKVLTGDWYHFQDAPDALPDDIKNVVSVVKASDSEEYSKIDPEYVEPKDGSIPGGCTLGALVMGRSGGGAKWTFTNGVLQLKINLHFTGGRTFKIVYQLDGESEQTVNISSISKGTYCNWDVLGQAGLTEAQAKKLKSISLLNTSSGGECRIYDMYIRVPSETTGINAVTTQKANTSKVVKFMQNGKLVIMKNGVKYNALGQQM